MRPITIRAGVLAAALAAGVIGCAQEREPINRVQANALQKSFFVGGDLADPTDDPEFYYRPTVVDVDYGADQSGLFTATYAQTLTRIKWEITEDLLVARLTFEHIADSTGMGSPDANTGQVAAAFRIEKHFDIKRGYNPQTGEELNVIEENTTDAPWYERKFMRVDWSQNLMTDAYDLDTLSMLKAFADEPMTYEPVAYYVEDPASPDAPVFDAEQGYFDVTNKVYVTPRTIETPWGNFPACFLTPDLFGGSGPAGNCNPVELKLRLSFRRVEDTDYEPLDWDGNRQDMFGMFTTGTLTPERYGYDRHYGIVDDKWYRFASRYDLWERSHALDEAGNPIPCFTKETTPPAGDPNRDADRNGTEDECEAAGSGARCDRWSHRCTIPYRERQTRTHAWHYGPGSDPTLFRSVQRASAEWDGALRHAVQSARYTECVHVGGVSKETIADCKAKYPPTLEAALEAVPPIIVMCHSPVQAGDPAACGEEGLTARVGDLRYHMVNIIQSPQTPSPWGILADAVDPLTGEVVAASINVWNHVTDFASQGTVDLMRWFLGELDNDDVISGQYLKDWVNYARSDTGQPGRTPPVLTEQEVNERIAGLDHSLTPERRRPVKLFGTQQQFMDWAAAKMRDKYGDDALGAGNTPISTRLDLARGSNIESELLTEPYLELSGLGGSTPIDETAVDLASPLRGNFFTQSLDLERQRQLQFAALGRCVVEAPEPSSVVDLARIMARKFPLADRDAEVEGVQATAGDVFERNEKWRDYLRKRFTFSVVIHEMGHSMGLRHVFTSSFDAMNFMPQYWQLRTNDGTVHDYCRRPSATGEDCVGPRWYDPVTQSERDGLIWMWQHTSVMDYPGDVTQDTLGIGSYDRAAIRFAYGDVVDVWDEPDAARGTRAGNLLADRLDSFGGIGGPWYGFPNPVHYSRLHDELNLVRNCHPADTSPPADWNEAVDGAYDPVFDSHIVNGTVCDGPPVDRVQYRDLLPEGTGAGQEIGVFGGNVLKFDPMDRVRRPYMFASDEYADLGNVAVFRHDNGADAYEITHFFISQYEDRHIFDNYRRNRTSFSIKRAVARAEGRYNEKIKELTKGYGLYHDILQSVSAIGDYTTGAGGDGLLKASALAAGLTFDHFARMLTRPASGSHFLTLDDSGRGEPILRSFDQILNVSQPMALTVPEGSLGNGVNVAYGGRPVHNALDSSKGYYATQYDLYAGSYYDKTLAIEFLTESVDRFISQSRDDFVDGRYRNISFANIFPEGVRRLIATSLTGDATMLGWRAPANSNRTLMTETTRKYPAQPIGWRLWWPEDGPATCWPSPGQQLCLEFPSETSVGSSAPPDFVTIDPEVGWEVQKFIIFWTMLYLPENWKADWVDMMRLWVVGDDTMPDFAPEETVVWRDPVSGQKYVAHGYGTEVIDGQTVQRGIGARTLEWANTLVERAYRVASEDPVTGEIVVERYADDSSCPSGMGHCAGQPIVVDKAYAVQLGNYRSVLDYMRTVASGFGFFDPEWRGVYE